MIRCVVLVLLGAAWGVEPPPPPDPYGLGERLALIDALRERFGAEVAPGTDLAELRARWAAAWTASQPPASVVGQPSDGSAQRARLIQQLRDCYGLRDVPDLPIAELEGLRDELERLVQQQERQAAAESPPSAATAPEPGPPPPSAAVRAVAPSRATGDAAIPADGIRLVDLAEPGVARCLLVTAPKPALVVQFGGERAGELTALYAPLLRLLAASPHIPSAVFLLGHGSGTMIAGHSIEAHLRRNRAFYETFAGTRPAAPVACLVIASCAAGSPNQMEEIRDGLGYYPVWRVGTWTRSYANAISVLGAFGGLCRQAADPPWRAVYLTGRADGTPASVAEAGRNGARGNLRYMDLVRQEGGLDWMER